jgi:hypothetical protein
MLPYLCLFLKSNSHIRTILREEWKQLSSLPDDLGWQIRKAFFDLLEVLQQWEVTPSTVVAEPSWTSLEIMSPEELCQWACELERLTDALFIYKSCPANDNPDMLTALRRHMGDTDVAQLHHDLEDIKLRVGVIGATAETSQTNFCILEWNSMTLAFMQ